MNPRQRFFATTAKGLEALLAAELTELGAEEIAVASAGASFSGALEVAYRACLWSRVASRVLLPLASFQAETPEQLYEGVRSIPWADHIDARGTLAVDGSLSQSALSHSHYAALKTKDAIVDQFRARFGMRPSVDVHEPQVRVNLYVRREEATVSIDLSGASLHQRAYRRRGLTAPLKENLAAAILLLADWPRLASEGAPFLDPMCGSGTLPIEAAMIAARIAPGRRRRFGFERWRGHDAPMWRRLLAEADESEIRDATRWPVIHGSDRDPSAVRNAAANADRAGLGGHVHLERCALADRHPPRPGKPGLLVANPPYGERLGEVASLASLYGEIGDVLRRRFPGWSAYVLAGNRELAKHIGLRSAHRIQVYNGALECRLLHFPISATPVTGPGGPGWRRRQPPASAG